MLRDRSIWITFVSLCLGLGSNAVFTAERSKQDLILNISSYHQGYAWSDATTEGIRQQLDEHYKFKTLYLDTKRQPQDRFQQASDKAWETVVQDKPRLIMLGDDNALKYLSHRSALSGIPTVFYGINANPRNYFPNQQRQLNMTGILERVPVVQLLRVVTSTLPDSRKILILSDGSTSGLGQKETQLHQNDVIKVGRAKASFIDRSTWDGWQSIVETAQQHYDAIILIGYHAVHDDNGVIDYMTNIRWTAKHAKIPVFSIQNHVGPEQAVGALVLDGGSHGKRAGAIAREILDGTKPASIAVQQEEKTQLLFSRQGLIKYGIKLPKHIKDRAMMLP